LLKRLSRGAVRLPGLADPRVGDADLLTVTVSEAVASVSPPNPAVYPHTNSGPETFGVKPTGIEKFPAGSLLTCTSNATTAPPLLGAS
jgi:hypothetical protein